MTIKPRNHLRKGEETLGYSGFKISNYIDCNEDKAFCRHCGKELKQWDEVYFCPNDKKLSCDYCKDKENDYDHMRFYTNPRMRRHTHPRAVLEYVKK